MTKDLSEGISSPAALRGTAMHQVLETCLKKGKHPSIFLDNVFSIEDKDVPFDEDMVRWTTDALEWVQEYKKEHKGSHLIAEAKLQAGKALSEELVDDIWGTADVLCYSKDELLVFDLKGGFVDVDVVDNYQLIIYAIGAVAHFEDAMSIEPIQNIRLVIHQPRTGGPKELVVFRETLDEWSKYIEKAAKAAKKQNAPLIASDEACKWCPVIGNCPAAHSRATELARNTDWPEVAETITEVQLIEVLKRAGFIRKFLDAAEQYALSRLENGYKIPGFKVVGSKKHRKWKDDEKAEDFLAARLGGKAWNKKLITPAQAEKLLRDDPKLKEYVITPEGDPVLAPESDPRPMLPWVEMKVLDNKTG